MSLFVWNVDTKSLSNSLHLPPQVQGKPSYRSHRRHRRLDSRWQVAAYGQNHEQCYVAVSFMQFENSSVESFSCW
ncbi:hypothetical protein ACOMHN_013680 [Nucella lapillus]